MWWLIVIGLMELKGIVGQAAVTISAVENKEKTVQNRIALDMLLAEKGGVCRIIGSTCCTFIPNNTSPDGSITRALEGLESLSKEWAENSGIDNPLCNVYRQEFNWLYKSPEGGQLKNQQPSKAPPPPQRKSARFLPIMEQRNVPGTFLKDICSFHDFQSIHKEIYGY